MYLSFVSVSASTSKVAVPGVGCQLHRRAPSGCDGQPLAGEVSTPVPGGPGGPGEDMSDIKMAGE